MKQLTLSTIPLICTAAMPLCADSQSMSSTRMQNGKPQTESERQFEQRWKEDQITPKAKPQDGGMYVTADFIWWKAQADGLEYAWTGAPLAPTAVPPSASKGNMLKTGFKYEPGFKVGLGYIFEHDGWDLYADYTWLRSNHKHHDDDDCCINNDVAWSNYWLPSEVGPIAVLMSDESARWKLHFNVLDIELGRNFYISKRLTMRPHFGMKFSWIKQHYDVGYDDILYSNSTTVIPLASSVALDFSQKQFGVGIRTGLNTAWYFTKMFAIYGDFAVSGLWNRFRDKRIDTVTAASGASYNSFDIKDKVRDVSAVIELGLGFRFEMGFCNDDYLLQLEAGWEDQIWFDQNQFITVEHLSPKKLSLEGLTVKAGLYF
jgi:hypothetical protein